MKIKIFNICSLFINVSIVILTILGFFDQISDISLFALNKYEIFIYFTTDSNLLLGLSSILIIPFILNNLIRNERKLPLWVSITRLVSVTSTLITFITVFTFLAPLDPDGYVEGIKNLVTYSFGLFVYHLLNPLLGFICTAFFEYEIKFKKIYALFSLIPTFVYGIFYCLNVLAFKVYEDFYGLAIVINGIQLWWLSFLILLIVSFLIGLLLIVIKSSIGKCFRVS